MEQRPFATYPTSLAPIAVLRSCIVLAVLLSLVVCHTGCHLFPHGDKLSPALDKMLSQGKHGPTAKSPLKPATLSKDSLVLDIFFIRFPYGEEQANEELWNEIDEQHFPSECRRKLSENGFRAGRIGGRVPQELSDLLELGEKPAAAGEANQLAAEEMEGGPRVRRRHLQLQPCRRSEIIASNEYEELPVITKDDSGQISGKFFKKARGMLALRAELERDGRVGLCVTPEIHHGQPRMKVKAGSQGVMQLDSSREHEVFDNLTAFATLSPGDMIVVSSLPGCPGSLGHHFFTETNSGKLEQKMLVIRLSQTQHDDLFSE